MTISNDERSSMIWGRNLTKQFGDHVVVEDINLDIPAGSIFGFIGPSGCGKTTTVRLLTGIYRPSHGEARVFGEFPDKFTQRDREKIGYMPQHSAHYPDLTVWENLNFAASIYGVGLMRKARLNQLLEFVELEGDKRKSARNLSGGMQRRLGLAAALVHHPELIFLDEPTAGIDPVLRRKFWGYFDELRGEGKTLFITTQYIAEAIYCDLVGIMREGRLLVIDTPQGLRRRALGGDIVFLRTNRPIDHTHIVLFNQLPFIRKNVEIIGENEMSLVVDDASTAMPALIEWCGSQNLVIDSIQEHAPAFDEIYITLLGRFAENE